MQVGAETAQEIMSTNQKTAGKSNIFFCIVFETSKS